MVADRDKEIRRLEGKLEKSESELQMLRLEKGKRQNDDELSCAVRRNARDNNTDGSVESACNQMKNAHEVKW